MSESLSLHGATGGDPVDPEGYKFDGKSNPHLSDASMFGRMYKPLPPVDLKNGTSFIITAREKAKRPVIRKEAREVLTGVFTFNPVFLKFLRGFSHAVEQAIEPDFDSDLFTRNGLHQTGDTFRVVAGYPQEPVSALPRSNKEERARLGLGASLTQRQKTIARLVWKEIWSSFKLTSLKIPHLSTSGAPRDVPDAGYKTQYFLAMQHPGRLEQCLASFERGDAETLYRDFEIAFLMGVNVRWQTDAPGKERYYWAIDDVNKSLSPVRRPITTSVNIEGQAYDDFAAMRVRMINQGSWTINSILQPFASGCMYAMFDKYPETWHREEDTIHEQMSGKHLYFSDVSNYDNTFTEEMLDITHDEMAEYITPAIAEMSRAYYFSSYFARPLDTEGVSKATLVGNPADIHTRHVVAGNRSGHALTSLMAKGWKVIESLWALDCIGYDAEKNFRQFLKGGMPCGTVNNGDDSIEWFDLERDYDLYSKFRESARPDWMFKVEREKGAVFSGRVFLKTETPLVYKQVQRLTTAFHKIHAPERSIGGLFRPFWPIGHVQRINLRDSHPTASLLWELHDRAWRDIAEPEFGSFFGNIQRAHQAMPFRQEALSMKDIEVLEDPAKLHHKYTDEEISQHVVEAHFKKVHHSHFEKMILNHYRGTLI